MTKCRVQFSLKPEEMPTQWYNIVPDLPEKMPPPIDPETGPSRLEQLPKLLVKECLKQEMSQERWIDIPPDVLELYWRAGRPRQLFRAVNLEKHLGTPARIYYKAEFYSPTGSHKVNTALPQVYYAKKEGFERVTTETGAGQWGTALAYAAALAGIKCTVFWVRAVHDWKPDRLALMKMFGAVVHASPSPMTEFGRKLYEKDNKHPGSLGIAISEGLEDSSRDDKAVYCLGSVLNHVLLHQTIIGLEAKKQFEMAGDYPDMVISCLGGGSNFGGFAIPFLHDALKEGKKTKFVGVQSEVSPNLTGEYRYDHADYAEMTPLLKMCTLGHKIDMLPIYGDGLRYHGCAPILSLLRNKGYIDAIAYPQDEKYVFERAKLFTNCEGFLPAPESSYGIAYAIDQAIECRGTGEKKVIAVNVSGHGFLDIFGFRKVLGI